MSDIEMFDKFIKFNPNPGIYHPEYMERIKSHSYRYFIPNWLKSYGKILDGGYYVNHKIIMRELKDIGISPQIYYDICILGLTNIDDRPKCNLSECKNSKFYNLNQGYQRYCCRSHQIKDRNRNIKEETREKLRISGKNHKVPENQRYLLSEIVKNDPSLREKAIRKSKETRKLKKIELGILDKDGNRIPKEKPPRRPRSDESRKRQSDRMKNYFKSHPEKIHVNGFKRFNNKTGKLYSTKARKELRFLSSWEEKFIKFIDATEYIDEVMIVPPIEYFNIEKNKISFYFADFFLKLKTGIKVLIEIKPERLYYNEIVRTKRESAINYCKKNGYFYITLTEKELFLKEGRYRNNAIFNMELNLYTIINEQKNITN